MLEDEEVVFEGGPAVLTNQRILASWTDARGREASVEAFLKDLVSFRKMNGGQHSRLMPGLRAMGAGIVVTAADLLFPNPPRWLDSLLFLVGSLAVIAGLYLVISTIFSVKPHTTVLFQTRDLKDIAVPFPGWDNPEAEELTRKFVRTKRGL